MSDWTGVRERVQALAVAPNSAEVFGARYHGFQLADPLTVADLSQVEFQLRAELPEDYRSFLLGVGAGGAGPAYGVFPLQRVGAVAWRWIGDGGDMTDPSLVAAPFPGPVDAEALDAILADRPEEEDFEDVDDYDPVFEAWDERLADLLYAPHRTAGAICICHEGCAQRVWLIVSGTERGRMWRDPRCDDEDLHPVVDGRGEPLDFAGWYRQWLAEAESACGIGQ